MDSLNLFEINILDKIQDIFKCSFLDNFFPIYTHICDAVVIIIIALILILFNKTRKAGLCSGIALIIGTILCNFIIKPLIFRTRPYMINESFNLLISPLKDGSFPSGHSVAAFEVSVSILCTMKKKWGILALFLAIIVSFSRLYLYVHFPSDVIAGIIIGILSGIVSSIIINIIYNKFSSRSKGFLV